ncbi:hypothetical protein FHC46_06850 [Enterobacter kobei]|nr:hypothetical protein [Enterobacter kobei]MBW9426045.1 hypothetical protein [Enterobacter kobei]
MNRESVWNIEPVTHDEKPNNPTGCDDGVRQHLNGEPDALKGARPVRGGEAGK